MQLHGKGLAWARNLMLFLGITSWAVAAPSNDQFNNSVEIGDAGMVSFGDNADASYESGEPFHDGAGGSGSVWWHWTAPANGTVEISTAGSNFDTLLAVYTGNSVSALTEITSNDDDEQSLGVYSRVSFAASAGTTYHIAVDGYGADAGNVVLSLSQGRGALTWASMSQGAPAIQAKTSGNGMQLSWARGSWPFTLETKPAVQGSTWVVSSLPHTLTQSNVVVNVPVELSANFFRLRRPPW